ncbi:hypothetical protein MGSAQ_002835, partial [marine sediment metagenome]
AGSWQGSGDGRGMAETATGMRAREGAGISVANGWCVVSSWREGCAALPVKASANQAFMR